MRWAIAALLFASLGCDKQPARHAAESAPPKPSQADPIEPQRAAAPESKSSSSGLKPVISKAYIGEVNARAGAKIVLLGDDLLIIEVEVQNPSAVLRTVYRGSANRNGESATLEDEHGNKYRHPSATSENDGILDQVNEEYINPRKSLADRYVFERPLDVAKHLTFTIPASSIGASRPYVAKFKTPAKRKAD